jgi:sarcosine oxidase, subunit alpha
VTRLDAGGWAIDRARTIRFRFDGDEYEGFAGDTLASALLANGVRAGFRSPVLGRPRGIMTAGVEEPNAFVAILEPWVDLIQAATMVPVVDGLVAESRAGVANLADAGPSTFVAAQHRYRHVETLVVGGGHEGVAAARAALTRGGRVLLVDERPHALEFALEGDDLEILIGATALGVYDDGYVVVHERDGRSECVWHVRAGQVILATGVHERPIAFAGNDRPGVMLATSVLSYLGRFGVTPGTRAVIFAAADVGAKIGDVYARSGIETVAVVDAEAGGRVIETRGDPAVREVVLREPDGSERTVEADLLAVNGGCNPVLGLWRAIGGGLRYDEDAACFVPDANGPPWLSVVGAAARPPAGRPLWTVEEGDDADKFVDLQRDQTLADIAAAVRGGLRSVEHVKRATYIGTAIDQGRTSGVATAAIVNQLAGAGPGAQGPTNARPPFTPVSYAALAGSYRGRMLDPERRTPIHAWHVAHGAAFENVGQWKRPWFFPGAGEHMEQAVLRECQGVRTGVGVMDASTLGKIDVVGSDAAVFLDRMYTNRMSTLAVGSIRYGLMCGPDGMAFDDGVVMRLGEERFFVTTTSGGAAKVLDRFEEWLQTEWTDLRVYCTSVTEHWATIAVNGTKAREVLAAAGTNVDLETAIFPFMSWREGEVAGMPARVARVSFSGELAYEINVAGWHGLAMWEAVMAAGQPFGITPYGTEAMHVLRAEKGFPIVGQDTDGTVTPLDLGMGWIVRKDDGDFVGRRSLRRPDTVRPDRNQLVGLLPADPDELLPEGAQLVRRDTGTIPMSMIGHVTSSYRSAALGRTFALAMLERGRELHGATVFAPLPDRTIAAEVASPVFWDPEGARRDG